MTMTAKPIFRLSVVFVISIVLFIDSSAQQLIEYGERVEGVLTHENPAQAYSFMGEGGDVIVVEMRSVDRTLENLLDAPRLILRDRDDLTLVDTLLSYPIDDAVLVAQLPYDDLYTVIATRDENVGVLSIGAFTLQVTNAQMLSADQTYEATLESGLTHADYYAIQRDDAVRLRYQHQSGDFHPQVSISVIDGEAPSGHTMQAVGYGPGLDEVILGTFSPGMTYLVTLTQAPFDYNETALAAEYALNLLP